MNKPVPPEGLSRRPASTSASGDPLPIPLLLGHILLRRKWLVIATTILLTLLAGGVVSQLTPLYTAQALIVLEPPDQSTAAELGAVLGGQSPDALSIDTEVQVLSSWGFAKRVIAQLDLQKDPELNAALVLPSLWSRYGHALILPVENFVHSMFGASPAAALDQAPASPDAITPDIVEAFLSNCTIEQVSGSRAVQISYTSSDPKTAAKVAQTMAELYITEKMSSRFAATRAVSKWLGQRIEDLRREVKTKNQEVQDYRRQHGLVNGQRGADVVNEAASQINAQLVQAEDARTQAQAQLHQIQTLMANGDAASAGAVINSSLMQGLLQSESRLEAQVSDYATRYSDQYPLMREAKAQLRKVKATIKQEIVKIAQSLANSVAIAEARVLALQARLKAIKGQAGNSNIAEAKLAGLEVEAQTSQDLLQAYLKQLHTTVGEAALIKQQPNARIISNADVPDQPSFPRTAAIMALSFVAAGVIATSLALLLELLDNSFRTSTELETDTGIRVLGHVPYIEGRSRRREGLAKAVLRWPKSIEAESVQRICMAIAVARKTGSNNRILFASAQPGEGKTSLAAAVARIHAASGERVLLIDADIHRPSLHAGMGIKRQPGLYEVVLQNVPFEKAVHFDSLSGAWVLPAGAAHADNPYRLFSSEQLAQFVLDVGNAFDLVVVDSPPIAAVSDALPLSRQTATIFVVRWAGAPKGQVINALQQLVEMGGQVLGTVLTQVNVEHYVKYGSSASGKYTRAVRRYYARTWPETDMPGLALKLLRLARGEDDGDRSQAGGSLVAGTAAGAASADGMRR